MDYANSKKRRGFRIRNETNERNNQQDWWKCFKNFVIHLWMMNWRKIRFTKNVRTYNWSNAKRNWTKMKDNWRIEIKSIKSHSNCCHGGFDGGDRFGCKIKYFLIYNFFNHGNCTFKHCGLIDHANCDLVVIKDKN